jgi:hypothetical protein
MVMKYLAFPKKMCKTFLGDFCPGGAAAPLPPSKYGPEYQWALIGFLVDIWWEDVSWNKGVSHDFDLDPVALKPKFPSALYLLNECRFLVDIWCEDVSRDKGLQPNFIFLAIGTRYAKMQPLLMHSSIEGTPIFQIMSLPQFQQDWRLPDLHALFKYEGSNEEINFTLLAWSCVQWAYDERR